MKVATWNINSVRLRQMSVLRLLKEEDIDILCLQETKVEDALFPLDAFASAGYTHTIFRGEKSYNGMAIISRLPLKNRHQQNFVKEECRHLAARLENGWEIHNFYVPAGADIPDPALNPHFAHKLKFVENATTWLKKERRPKDKMILFGDLNIAPFEHDVWSHKQLLNVVSHTPAEVERLNQMKDSLQWIDIAREFVDEKEKLYSWWSYRNRDWRKSNRGRRLDHIWITSPLKSSIKQFDILRDWRDMPSPSDHVPVIATFAD